MAQSLVRLHNLCPEIGKNLTKDESIRNDETHALLASLQGFLVRALIDSGKFTWYHYLYDRATYESSGSTMDMQEMLLFHVKNVADGSASAVHTLQRMLDMHGITRCPAKLFRDLARESDRTEDHPDWCVRIPRLLLSPCQKQVTGLELETSNRAIRQFTEKHVFCGSSFIRVQIGDENAGKLFASELSETVEAKFKRALLSCIEINGRHYRFFVYPSSQLKDASVWMVNLQPGWSVQRMRESLGDFSGCKTASKYAARIVETTVFLYNVSKFDST